MEKQREGRKELEMQQLDVAVFLISPFLMLRSNCAVLQVLCTQLRCGIVLKIFHLKAHLL